MESVLPYISYSSMVALGLALAFRLAYRTSPDPENSPANHLAWNSLALSFLLGTAYFTLRIWSAGRHSEAALIFAGVAILGFVVAVLAARRINTWRRRRR